MSWSTRISRRQFAEYRSDLKAHRTEGSSRTGRAHRRQRSFIQLVGAFLRMMGARKRTVAVALGLLTVATALSLVPPYATKLVVDNILADNPLPPWAQALDLPSDRKDLLGLLAVTIVAISLVSIVAGIWSRWLATRTTKRVQVAIRRDVFTHAVRLPLHRVYQLKSGGVASILREDAGGIADLVFAMLYNPWRAIIQLIGSLIILTWVDWRLLLGSLLLLPTVYVTHRTWISRIRPVWRDIRNSRQIIDGQATEAFGGMRVVRTFGRQHSEVGRFTRRNHFMARQELMVWWWSRAVDLAWSILLPLASAALLWYGGWRILTDAEKIEAGLITFDQALTTGDLVMFLAYLAFLLSPLATLASSATQFQNSLAGLDRVLDLLDEPREFAEHAEDATRIEPGDVQGRLTLRDVGFTYPAADAPALYDIDLDIEAGETIALVGRSGSGKTTICNLIARFYDPTSGAIELDGTDVRRIEVDSYRRGLGIVEQDIFLFDGTVAENIGYARRGAAREDIEEAARLANAHDFIVELERGYDTIIGERGVRLSGGQRQRIAIARALLADPRILILDEATSNLDTESERLIQDGLQTLMRERTTIVIAHRLSTVINADRIIVIEGGRIVEQGSHAALIEASGRYRAMAVEQLGAEAV